MVRDNRQLYITLSLTHYMISKHTLFSFMHDQKQLRSQKRMFPDIGTNENMVTRYLYIYVIVPEIVNGITEHVKKIQLMILSL